MVLEKTLESPLDSKEIKPVNPKGNQPWLFIRRTDAEAEAPILWLLDVKSWFIVKYPYHFAEGAKPYVELTNKGADGTIVADAVQFIPKNR